MTPERSSIPCALAALLVVLLAVLVAVPAVAAQDGLELRLELEESRVGLAEPVYALVTLANRGEAAVEVYADLAPESGLLQIEVQPPVGPALPFVPLAVDDVELEKRALAAGEEVYGVVELFYGGRGWTFGRAGVWKVSAVYAPPGGPRLAAGPVELSIDNTAAGLYLFGATGETSAQTGKFMVWQQGDHLELAREHLRGLLAKHPQSDLASFARLALGLNLARPFRRLADGTSRPPRWSEALALLAAVDPEALPPSQRLRLFAGRLEAAIATDRAAEAHEALAAAREAAEGRPDLSARLEALLERLPPLPEVRRPGER